MQYLATTKGPADHWYPADPRKRARVNEYIMWHATGMIPKNNLFGLVVGSFCHESPRPACHLPCSKSGLHAVLEVQCKEVQDRVTPRKE